MTTAGSNGAPEGPADDDPFAYLYRPAEGEAAATQPRNSYARPMEVGRAQYGQQPPAQPYRAQPQAPQAQPTTQLPLPQQQTRYAERSRPQPGEDRPSGGRGKATVIGAVAVVAAIAVGAGIALSGGDPGKKDAGPNPHTSAPVHPSSSSASPSSASTSPTASTAPVADASQLQAQGAASANTVKGAVSADGSYLTLQAGSSFTWTVSVPTAGKYKFWLHFNNAGSDLPAAVAINGKDRDGGVTLKNYSKGNTDPSQAWFATNIWPDLQEGSNTITVSLPAGSSGSVLLDQVALTAMSVGDYPKS